MLKGLNLAGKSPIASPRVISANDAAFVAVVKDETREADRLIAETDKILDGTPHESPVVERSEENISDADDKLSRLVDDDFPFDDTQLTAIYGIVQQQYACMIGAAGTGKTTTTKKLVDMLRDGLDAIDVSKYWIRGSTAEDDDYEIPEKLIPSIAMVSFTGRATQMIKKNFPRDWHGNIMTIHRALGFYPEYYQDLDPEVGEMVGKRRFVPAYTAENLMPWDIIIVDEAGMLGLELWHQLWAATKPTCRIILIGDINQLPPTHGKSVLGFALANWPTWELTHVHRQQGANNSIVDNAHRILKGIRPISDSPTPLSLKSDKEMLAALNYMAKDDSWRFITVEVPEDHRMASLRIRQCLQLLQGKIYEPNRDVLITPINGFEQTNPGYSLGQEPLNQELVVKLNSKNPRYLIDAGREKQNFAVGDKVMATVNDYEAGITNGMTGIVTAITANGAYIGDTNRWGLIDEVNEYLSGLADTEDDDFDFSLEEMVSDSQAGMDELKKKDKKDAGPASHIVEVEFGEGEHAFRLNFDSKSKVASLMLAYAATCHKMQGGECPVVFGIIHQANKRPLNREWAYTMVTRASQRCIVFTTRQGLGFALGKQNIKGSTLEAKIKTFVALTQVGLVGASVRVKLPKPRSLGTDVIQHQPMEIISAESEETVSESQGGDGALKAISQGAVDRRPSVLSGFRTPAENDAIAEASRQADSRHTPKRDDAPSIKVGALHIHIHQASHGESRDFDRRQTRTVDGGELRATPNRPDERTGIAETPRTPRVAGPLAGLNQVRLFAQNPDLNVKRELAALLAPAPLVSQYGAVAMLHKIEDDQRVLRLTHNSAGGSIGGVPNSSARLDAALALLQKPKPVPSPTKPLSIGALLAKGRN